MACAIEDAGFEIRDQLQWIYGSGFPKSHDVSKGIDKSLGLENEREITHYKGQGPRSMFDGGKPRPASLPASQWNGWGTSLKPACEPICLARKPLSEKSIAANVLKHGTGAINVDGCRIGTEETIKATRNYVAGGLEPGGMQKGPGAFAVYKQNDAGRWPANVLHDGSDEVLAGFPQSESTRSKVTSNPGAIYGNGAGLPSHTGVYGFDDQGSAARYFYSAKAGPLDRIGSKHPTIKPIDLMRWLVRLVTPPGGLILEPFAGSGSTGIAALAEGFDCTMIDLEADHVADIERKLAFLRGEGRMRIEEHLNGREQHKPSAIDLFSREQAA
jgi:site-specific DNA-methyltransferase (adenine-specific)